MTEEDVKVIIGKPLSTNLLNGYTDDLIKKSFFIKKIILTMENSSFQILPGNIMVFFTIRNVW